MSEFKDRLKQARKSAKLTQLQLATAVNTTQGSISDLESGRNKSTTNLIEMAQVLNVNPTWLATGKGEMKANSGIFVGGNNTNYGSQFVGSQTNIHNNVKPVSSQKIAPLINWVQAGTFTEVGDNVYDEYLPYFGDYGNDNVYWLCIVGNSMTPDFREGEYVLINKDRQAVAGNYVVALEHGREKVTFKKYRPKGFDDNGTEYFHLIPSNEEYPIIDSRYQPFDVVGVAVERNQKLI